MIDLHTHLDLYPNALNILARVNHANRFTLAVTTSPRAWLATSQVFKDYRNIKVALGLHPEIAIEKFNELDMLLGSVQKTFFIGEVGIDGSPKYLKTLHKQELIFDNTIRECEKAGGRIISIHSRSAVSKVLSVLKKYPDSGRPVLHWFSGSISELKEAIEIGCFFSVNPVMVLTKKGQELISRIPARLILPESDGPFASRKGNPVMPWEAIDIVNVLSKIWSVPIQAVEETFFKNLNSLMDGEPQFDS